MQVSWYNENSMKVCNVEKKGGTFMYPSRTDRKKAEDQAKHMRQLRFWTAVNIALIVVVAALLIYYFKEWGG
ncbi:hypothetical protein XI25_16240 [Paenibacillus sp. DMB20]|nr:hypothetical protein XI25_16240 [Paenibacillus sp. DMB20]